VAQDADVVGRRIPHDCRGALSCLRIELKAGRRGRWTFVRPEPGQRHRGRWSAERYPEDTACRSRGRRVKRNRAGATLVRPELEGVGAGVDSRGWREGEVLSAKPPFRKRAWGIAGVLASDRN